MTINTSLGQDTQAMAPQSNGLLSWHDCTRVLGVDVNAFFFDGAEVDARVDFVERHLPMFTQARPQLLNGAGQNQRLVVADLCAQPYAVLAHGNGLICLDIQRKNGRPLDRQRWASQLRVDSMLHCVANAMVLAAARQLPVVALMRLENAVLQYAPSPAVLECLAISVASARRYWAVSEPLTVLQWVGFCEPLLRKLPGVCAAESGVALSPSPGA